MISLSLYHTSLLTNKEVQKHVRRRSLRDKKKAKTVPHRINNLFHKSDPTLGSSKITMLRSDPNIFWVENFLSDSEIEYFDVICTNNSRHFSSSFTEDVDHKKIVSEERTSTYLQLTKAQDITTRAVECRAADMVGISSEFVEPLQIVRYTRGQQFNIHHDGGTLLDDGTVDALTPRRLVTLFIYLNSLPEGQGCTEFPLLNLKIAPKKGCALIFCNIQQTGEIDCRLVHRACPGTGNLTKYGINVRLYLYPTFLFEY